MKSITCGVALALSLAAAPASAQTGQSEIELLRAQIEALSARLEALESRQARAETASVPAPEPAPADRVRIKADLRYRYEAIDEEGREDRDRQRIRARIGIVGNVSESVELGVQFATGGDDPRSTNQTLGGDGSTKSLGTDLAYAKWRATDGMDVIFGKMKYPWVRMPVSYFFDSDYHPEGLAVMYDTGGMVFANAHWLQIAERSADDDSSVWGGQLGLRGKLGGVGLSGMVAFQDFVNVQGFSPCYQNDCNGNTVDGDGNLVYDYDMAYAGGGLSFDAGLPVGVFAGYVVNLDADEDDTGWTVGARLGRRSAPGTWELAALYQDMEKDAFYGGLVDSDFAAGNTDGRGYVLKGAYGLANNIGLVFTYFANEIDVTADKRDYDKYQLDVSWKY
jgi:hypothetical protein